MLKTLQKSAPMIMFVLSCSFFTFLYGLAAGRYQLFPFGQIKDALHTLKTLGSQEIKGHFLFPIRHSVSGVTHFKELKTDEVTLLTSYFDGVTGIRLINTKGSILHSWRLDPSKIWPESPFNDITKGSKNVSNNYVHGSYLFPNGDILFNIEYMGLVRMNAQGKVLWILPRRTHHSITPTKDGNFWVCGMKLIEEGNERGKLFPGLKMPFAEDSVLQISPEGKILQEFSVLKALFDSGHQRLIWKPGQTNTNDMLHLNDVEPLPKELASQYPSLKPNDLIVSMRNINTIAALDSQTGQLKWLHTDSFIRQHDPDFIGDGWIRVFDNNDDGSHEGEWLGGSRIIDIRPDTNETRVVFPVDDTTPFHTMASGKSQTLPNGNLLISEARGGRVFEVDTQGHVIWQWVQEPWPADPTRVAAVQEGTRYPNITPQMIKSWAEGKP